MDSEKCFYVSINDGLGVDKIIFSDIDEANEVTCNLNRYLQKKGFDYEAQVVPIEPIKCEEETQMNRYITITRTEAETCIKALADCAENAGGDFAEECKLIMNFMLRRMR